MAAGAPTIVSELRVINKKEAKKKRERLMQFTCPWRPGTWLYSNPRETGQQCKSKIVKNLKCESKIQVLIIRSKERINSG